MSLTALIAEDEYYTRKNIIKMVSSCPCAQPLAILEAASIRTALTEIENTSQIPDIALLDIWMNGEDCFPLVHSLKTLNPDVQIAFITGYSEFHYAQEAIRLGIKDYLVKPVDTQSLCDMLDRMLGSVMDCMGRKLRTLLERRMLLGTYNRYHSEDWHDLCCLPVMILNHQPDNPIKVESILVRGPLDHPVIIDICVGGFPVTLIIYFYNEMNMAHQTYDTVLNALNVLSECEHEKLSIVLGCVCNGSDGIQQMFNSLFLYAYNVYRAQGSGRILIQSEESFESKEVSSDFLVRLRKLIQDGNPGGVEHFIRDAWANALLNERGLSRLISLLNEVSLSLGEDGVVQMDHAFVVDSLWDMNSNDELISALCTYARRLCTYFDQGESSSQRQMVSAIKEYIDNHYQEDICIRDIAQNVFFIHSKYLSSLFSKVEGITISDYVLHKRMERARYLITNTDKSITEISGEIGYNSLSYFIHKFKKYYGYVPSSIK